MVDDESQSLSDKIKGLVHARNLIFEALSRFTNYTDNFTDFSKIYQLQSRLEKIQILWTEFASVQADLEIFDTTSSHKEFRIQFEDEFFNSTGEAKARIDHYYRGLAQQNAQQNISAQSPSNINNTTNVNTNLPKIKLPEFCGSYDKWLQFADTFKSLIHNVSHISKIEKFWYLKSCLKGDAANVLNSLEVSDSNYDKAWQILCQRYENKRVIIRTHLKELYAIQVIPKESHLLLRGLIDTSVQHLRALDSLGLPVASWNTILIFHLSSKLDASTRREWEDYSLKLASDTPSFEEFITFISKRCQILESIYATKSQGSDKGSYSKQGHTKSFPINNAPSLSCILCKQNHYIFACADFLKMNPQERLSKIKNLHACTNCLRLGHFSNDCKNQSSCKKCSFRHNSLLHLSGRNKQTIKNNSDNLNPNLSQTTAGISENNSESASNNNNKSQSLSVLENQITDSHYVLLPTAKVTVFDSNNKPFVCRALLDNCSQSNFITEEMFKKLNLPNINTIHTVQGFGNNVTKIFSSTNLNIKSNINSFRLNNLPVLVTDKITQNLPEFVLNIQHLEIPKNIILADDNFDKSGPVDMLLGASVFWSLICVGQIVLPNNLTILQKTKLGWIISGPLPIYHSKASVCNLTIDSDLNRQLQRFWEVEEIPSKCLNSLEEDECENHFIKTTYRNNSGKFVVNLPFKENVTDLGVSFDMALKRFYALEKRLDKNPKMKSQYVSFMAEYEQLGHMSKINSFNLQYYVNKAEFFLPHHGVFKDSRTTTKLRVVFDGSAKTSNGLSLNDTLKVGPKLQDDLFDLILRFRTYKFAFTADIEKMYRCVLVEPSQRSFQKILWRANSSHKVDHYSLNTVTYGTASASFLAIRCLQQIAIENKDDFPEACKQIMSSFYVDDFLCGSDSIEQGQTLICQVSKILESAGFNLRKWVASNDNLLNNISEVCISTTKIISDNKTVKTLGLTWDSQEDTFLYTIHVPDKGRVTKRFILSITAQIFDPMGLVGPCIIKAKIILQILWQLDIDWDESVPMDLHDSWIQFYNKIPILNELKIPRNIILPEFSKIELHGFSDASMKAYGACCYIRSINSVGQISVALVCAKSRVAPLKTLTLPRLELCAALLLIKVAQRVLSSLKINIDISYYWTDSTIVLSWLALQPNQLNTFVANRISEIQQVSKNDQWHHIPSEANPADVISRGLDPDKLKDCNLWWFGPSFLKSDDKEHWPKDLIPSSSPDISELKKTKHIFVTQIRIDTSFIDKFSSLTKLQRCFAYCLRFLYNCRTKIKNQRLSGFLSRLELQGAMIALSKLVQSHHFFDELKCLKKSQPLSSSSPILRLNPFLDKDGLMRVGGRLLYSNYSFDFKHPILLPSNSHLTYLIILYEHKRLLHAGAQSTLSAIRHNYWPINGRNTVQKLLRKCVTCFKVNPVPAAYQMGNLPEARVTPQRPFFITGVDFAGPFWVKDGKAKNRTLVKTYLCVFICFTTKASHLELAGDLSSEGFLNCFKRFVSRRGICSELYSDNGTNFVGAENDMKNVLKQIKSDERFLEFLSINQITWHFSPPYGPNFGGLWEACVKQAKLLLKRIIGNCHFTYESLSTVFVQVEAVLNSRPITPLSNDPNDFDALTPSHFLIGEALTALPQIDLRHIPENRLSHFKLLQQQLQHFWQQWSAHYVTTLQERTKWNKQCQNVAVGTLVLIKDENSAPLCWKLGRVIEVFPGRDQVIRVVNVQTKQGIMKRPVTKLCALPIDYL